MWCMPSCLYCPLSLVLGGLTRPVARLGTTLTVAWCWKACLQRRGRKPWWVLTTLMNLATHNSDSTYGADSYLDTSGTHYSALELAARFSDEVLAGSLVRRIEPSFFPVDAAPWQKSMTLAAGDAPVSFVTTERQLPEPIPSNWRVTPLDDGKQVRVDITGACDVLVPSQRVLRRAGGGHVAYGF
jgi:acetoacetyl-[acyl-carrier protein] synthase